MNSRIKAFDNQWSFLIAQTCVMGAAIYCVAYLLKIYTPFSGFLELGVVSLIVSGLMHYRDSLYKKQQKFYAEFDKRIDRLEGSAGEHKVTCLGLNQDVQFLQQEVVRLQSQMMYFEKEILRT